jgi:glycosyltransferase involved in cell wall biosynthesis
MTAVRVIHFISTNFIGGPERQVLSHLKRYVQMGNEALVVSFDEPGGIQMAQAVQALNLSIPTLLLPARIRDVGPVRRQLKSLYLSWQPDLICTHGYKPLFYSLSLRGANHVPVVAFSRGWTADDFKVQIYCYLDKAMIRFADRIVAVSKSQGEKLRALKISAKKIQIIENALTVKIEDLPSIDQKDIRKKLGIPEDAWVVLSAGRHSPEKGHKYLIEALPALRALVPQAYLVLAGDGPLSEELKNQANRLNISSHCLFLGMRKDMPAIYKASNAMALPSLSEGLPNVVLEAMAFGVPVVASEVGGVPEVIDHNVNGLLVKPASPKNLAQALATLANDPNLANKLAQQAKLDVEHRFNADVQTQRLIKLYHEVVS